MVGPWPYRLMHSGDRRSDWERVGWPDHYQPLACAS
jgi:hypothetical protein